MPEEWRNKGNVQNSGNYRGMMGCVMKLWEKVIEARLGREVTIKEQ